MRFAEPSFLPWLALLLPLAAFLFWSWRKKSRELAAFTGTAFAALLAGDLSRRRQKAKDVLRLAALALAVTALAGPQWGERWEESKRRGIDLFVAVDVSKSMLAGDVSPSRLERARRKVLDLAGLLEGDRVGLIAFAGRAFVLMPPTLDYGALPLFLDALTPDAVSLPGTAVAQAIDLALKSFESEGSPESRSVILMTDGEDLAGDALRAVQTAREQGVQINVLGIGTPEGAPIPVNPDEGGGFKKDAEGRLILTRLDETALQRIAGETGGAYVRSVAGDDDLRLLYDTIREGRLEKELKSGRERHLIDRYQWFLGGAVLLLLLEAFLKETKKSARGKPAAVAALLFLVLVPTRPLFAFGTVGTIREGERLYEAGRYEEALRKFQEAERKKPDDPRLQYNLGAAYHRLKRYDDAAKSFAKAARGEKTLYNEGNNRYRQGALEDAIASYEEALKLDPNDEDARYNLEFVKKQLEKKKQEQQQRKSPESRPSQDQQGPARDQQGQQGDRQKDQQKQEGQGKEQQHEKPSQESQGQGGEPRPQGTMSRQEAERWLSGLSEGRPKVYSGEKKNDGERRVEKDW